MIALSFKLKWFHRLAGWLGVSLVYESRFIPASATRNISGSLEWRTTDWREAMQLWDKSQQSTRSQHGKFYLSIEIFIDSCSAQRSEKKPSRHQREIDFQLSETVPGEAQAARAESDRQEDSAHDNQGNEGHRTDHRQPSGSDEASRVGQSMAIGSARRQAEAKAAQASRHAGGLDDLGRFPKH